MSRWNDYGFPQIDGVPLGVLLEGLYLACAERIRCLGFYNDTEGEVSNENLSINGYNYMFRSSPCPYIRIIDAVESMTAASFSHNTRDIMRITPQFEVLSLENLAKTLGEELVRSPVDRARPGDEWGPVGAGGYIPWSDITYDWVAQRYRMINISNLASHVIVDYSSPRWNNFFYRQMCRDSGSQETVEDAKSELKTIEGSWNFCQDLASCLKVHFDSGGEAQSYRLEQIISVPERMTYQLDSPSTVRVYGTPLLSSYFQGTGDFPFDRTAARQFHSQKVDDGTMSRSYTFDTMGLELEQNKFTLLKEFQTPENIKYDDDLSIPELADDFFARFSGTLPSGVSGNRSLCVNHLGAKIQYYVLYDYSQQLEFFDPVEIKGESL